MKCDSGCRIGYGCPVHDPSMHEEVQIVKHDGIQKMITLRTEPDWKVIAKELEDRMEQIRACLIELEHLTRKDRG